MRPSKKFTIRVFVYSAILLYIAGDLFLFDGPIKQKVEDTRPDSEASIEYAREHGIAAYVMGNPIYLSQVERAAWIGLWLRGKKIEDLPPSQRRIERLAALNELIDHELLRNKTRYNMDSVPVSEEEIDTEVLRFASRFSSRDDMQATLAAEGIDSEKELRYRLAARIQQEKYIESRIAEGIATTEEEAKSWYENHKQRFAMDRRIRARHIFIATLNTPSDQAKAKLAAALAELQSGIKSFDALALAISEDYRTKSSGGDLGWMTRERLPEQFGEAVFAMPLKKPQLVQSKIGWHLVEVTDELPARERSYDEVKKEVMAALESYKRMEMTQRMREAMRNSPDVNVHVYEELIPAE